MRSMTFALLVSSAAAVGALGREPAEAPSARLFLHCDQATVQKAEPLFCQVLLQVEESVGTAFVPRTVTPFPIPPRPPAVLRFFARLGDREVPLDLTTGAVRGRYDLGALRPWEIQSIGGDEIIGWRKNLNGDDWELPAVAGKIQLIAELEISYHGDGPFKNLAAPVRAALDSCFMYTDLSKLEGHFLVGKWRSPPVDIAILPAEEKKP